MCALACCTVCLSPAAVVCACRVELPLFWSPRDSAHAQDDFARLISLFISSDASPFVDAYRSSLNRAELDAGLRNTGLFSGLAGLFNDAALELPHPDAKCEWCKDMQPNAESTFKNERSGAVLSKKWCEVKAWYSEA